MRITAYLGAYGYGNLGDELCLMEAMRAFPSEQSHALSVAPDWTLRCVPGLTGCFREGAEMLALRPGRVVFGGGMFGVPDAFRAWMPWLARAEAEGAEIHLHNLGIAWHPAKVEWLDSTARGVIARLGSFTVRDYASVERVARIGFGRMPRITFFPETDIPAEPDLAASLLPRDGRRLLGLSIIPTQEMRDCLAQDAARVRALLAGFADHAVVPIISTVHVDSAAEDDMVGVGDFLRDFLPDAEIAAPLLLDRAHWQAALTPARLKGLVARLDTLITQRKHNAIHAIGSGVRVIGLHPMVDNSLRRTFVTLAHRLPPGSRCVGLDSPPVAAA